jgi:glycosyltransferase involved in cell wall biosynthesis
VGAEHGIHVVTRRSSWRWGRWYSRSPMTASITGMGARAVQQAWLASEISRRHAWRRYDVVYQFSQPELLYLRRFRHRLPSIVVQPETHAAGELRALYRERKLAQRCEPLGRRAAAYTLMSGRAALQKVDLRLARRIMAVSRVHADHMARDYHLPSERFRLVPNPVDLERFRAAPMPPTDGLIVLLFSSRIAVRKGVEMVVDLSHRLADLAGRVRIDVIGGPSLWSDYTPLLRGLNPAVARYLGSHPPESVADQLRAAHVALQPSHFDPCPLSVAEALATGRPVVASTEVGTTEAIDPSVCRLFDPGDTAGFESAIRRLLTELWSGSGGALSATARSEAERRLSTSAVAATLHSHLAELVDEQSRDSR